MNDKKRWVIVCIYAIAMAWVESAVVYYLRTLVHRLEPYQVDPFPVVGGLAQVEVVREAATLIMLFTVGMLAGRTWRGCLGYSAIAFGMWDIFYYVFLKIMYGWPHSVMDWDILFLIPLPWWGPVWAPVLISVLLILWGTLGSQFGHVPARFRARLTALAIGAAGVVTALCVFMADAMEAAPRGAVAVRNVLPTSFHWQAFAGALLLMSAPVIHRAWLLWMQPRQPLSISTNMAR